MNRPPPPPPRPIVMRRRAQLVLIAALFLGPLALSFWAYYGMRFRPAGHTNQGELIEPARPLPDAVLATSGGSVTSAALLHGHWSLLYVAGTDCDARCAEALAETRGARRALGTNIARVRRVLLVDAPCCEAAAPAGVRADLAIAWLRDADGRRLLDAFPAGGASVALAGRVYIVDPLGNLMMSYAPDAGEQAMVRDLEQLLRLSHIG